MAIAALIYKNYPVFAAAIQAIAAVALVLVTGIYVYQNREQMKYIQRPYNRRYIIESLYAELEQNLNIHEQIFNKFAELAFEEDKRNFEHYQSIEEISGDAAEKNAQRGITAIFETGVWDDAKLKISKEDLDEMDIDYETETIKKIFANDYPFKAKYSIPKDFSNDKKDTSFYHRLKATYSRIKIQNEIAIKLRYATDPGNRNYQCEQIKNYFNKAYFLLLLHDFVRARSYLKQALSNLAETQSRDK